MWGPYRFARSRAAIGFLIAGACTRQALLMNSTGNALAWLAVAALFALAAAEFAGWLSKPRRP